MGKRSQKSCGQISKPHESELNSQTPQLSAHGRLPRASSLPLCRRLKAPGLPSVTPEQMGRVEQGSGWPVCLLCGHPQPLLWPPACPLDLSSPPQASQVCSGSAQLGAAPGTSCSPWSSRLPICSGPSREPGRTLALRQAWSSSDDPPLHQACGGTKPTCGGGHAPAHLERRHWEHRFQHRGGEGVQLEGQDSLSVESHPSSAILHLTKQAPETPPQPATGTGHRVRGQCLSLGPLVGRGLSLSRSLLAAGGAPLLPPRGGLYPQLPCLGAGGPLARWGLLSLSSYRPAWRARRLGCGGRSWSTAWT